MRERGQVGGPVLPFGLVVVVVLMVLVWAEVSPVVQGVTCAGFLGCDGAGFLWVAGGVSLAVFGGVLLFQHRWGGGAAEEEANSDEPDTELEEPPRV